MRGVAREVCACDCLYGFRGLEVERRPLDEARKVSEDTVERSDERGGAVRLLERDRFVIPEARIEPGRSEVFLESPREAVDPEQSQGEACREERVGEGGRGGKERPPGTCRAGTPERDPGTVPDGPVRSTA